MNLNPPAGRRRFLTFVRDNFPELQCTALELSPHYLEAGAYTRPLFGST